MRTDDRRRVTLVLCSSTGEAVGTLPTFDIPDPWWPEVEPIQKTIRVRFGVDVSILRLLRGDPARTPRGGDVTYLAELRSAAPPKRSLGPVPEDFDARDHPLRAPWARPGGIDATVAWADRVLHDIGMPRTGPVVQVKSWNLSSVLRLPTRQGDVWCKSVPPFMAHEATVFQLLRETDPTLVPRLVAADRAGATVLLRDAGVAQWAAPVSVLVEMVTALVAAQARGMHRSEALLDAGIPDQRMDVFQERLETLLQRRSVRDTLSPDELGEVERWIATLPGRSQQIAACGMPATLIHGDFHPGNWHADGGRLSLIDWGDSAVGHPLLDLPSFIDRIPHDARRPVRQAWFDVWQRELPGSDPRRAAELIGPIAEARLALVYQGFLDAIEPDERLYHAADVPDRLRATIRRARMTS